MDYRCHDRVSGNELNAKHWNQKRAANGRTYHTEEKVCHQSSSPVAERDDTTEHQSNHHNDNDNLGLKAHLGSWRTTFSKELWTSMPPLQLDAIVPFVG
jgi:hypothetical protein